MALENEQPVWITEVPKVNNEYLQKFRLYETRSNFYMIGRSKNRSTWRVLKIDRSEPTELIITEDPTTYTEVECCDLLKRVHDGNKSTGGLRFVCTCYGIVGFIKFLGPYYMLLITKRRKIGVICGHAIYAISKSEILPIPNSTVQPSVAYSKNENRYKKLLCSVDLTKDFYFSYSYRVMHSFQKNLSTHESGNETMFVWNEFLTGTIYNQLRNNLWTVQLVYGYFKQVKLSIGEKDFKLTLIARRSRHYAGTRYLKRGVNEKGRVANDVETEQIVFEDVPDGCPVQISSVVQNRGSIPLFWSQETSRLNIKPDIILSKKDQKYDATRLHFENLVKRYGNPIIILNLIKTKEKKPRESLLRVEFAHAIESINKDLPEEKRLKFLHWDLNKYSRNKSTNVLALLGKVATYALNLTGFFYCQVVPNSTSQELLNCSRDDKNNNADDFSFKPPKYQTGVLRTNCIDCLDRTNVAQFAYGWAALGRQLHTMGYIDTPVIELDSTLADDLMRIYEKMGDTLALQYGGSAAHNKVMHFQYKIVFGLDRSIQRANLHKKKMNAGMLSGLSNQLNLAWIKAIKAPTYLNDFLVPHHKKVNMVNKNLLPVYAIGPLEKVEANLQFSSQLMICVEGLHLWRRAWVPITCHPYLRFFLSLNPWITGNRFCLHSFKDSKCFMKSQKSLLSKHIVYAGKFQTNCL